MTAGLLGFSAAMAVVVMTLMFAIERARRDASHVDVAWAATIGGLSVVYAVAADMDVRAWIVMATALTWSLRLASYLLFNRVIGQPEDGRYRALREKWGEPNTVQFFVVFQIQAALAWVLSLPIAVAIFNPSPAPRAWEWLAVAVAVVSIAGESVADRQLARFRARPDAKGKTCREGLWRYSRHPNYFFEWLGWWAWVLAAVGSPWFAISWIGPVLMLVLLFRVTGIPATEEQALKSRGDDYRRYQRSTSAFVPWFPRLEEER